MYDSGYLAVVRVDFYTYVEPLDPKEWRCVTKDNAEYPPEKPVAERK